MKLKRLFLVFLFTVLYIGQSFLTPVEASAATLPSGLVLVEDTGGVAVFSELVPSVEVQQSIFDDLKMRDDRVDQVTEQTKNGLTFDYILSATMVNDYSSDVSGYRFLFARHMEQLSLLDDVIQVNIRVANGVDIPALEASTAPIPAKENASFGMNYDYVYGYNYDATGAYVSTIYRTPGSEQDGLTSLYVNYATKPWVNYGNRIIYTNAENAGNVSPWSILESYESIPAPDGGSIFDMNFLEAMHYYFFEYLPEIFTVFGKDIIEGISIEINSFLEMGNLIKDTLAGIAGAVINGITDFFAPWVTAWDSFVNDLFGAVGNVATVVLDLFLSAIFPSQEQWGLIQDEFNEMMTKQFGILYEALEMLTTQLNPMLVEFDEVKTINAGNLFGSPMVIDLGALERDFPEVWLVLVSAIRLFVWSRVLSAFFKRAVSILNGATAGAYDDAGYVFMDDFQPMGVNTKMANYHNGLNNARIYRGKMENRISSKLRGGG